MKNDKVELIFRFVPRAKEKHLVTSLRASVKRLDPTRRLCDDQPQDLFGAIISLGLIDLLRGSHHDYEEEVSVWVSLGEFAMILTCTTNLKGTLEATGATPVDIVARPELLITHYARHATRSEWAERLRVQGLPTCVGINGAPNHRRPLARKVHSVTN